MADVKGGGGPEREGGDPAKPRLQEEKILARLAGDPTQVPAGLTSFVGLLGRSPKEGHWLLYLTLDMGLYVEIREDDIVHSEQLPADRSPFGGLGGTRLYVKKNAEVTTTRTVSRTHEAGAEDEFDLDIQLGGGTGVTPRAICVGTEDGTTCAAECGGGGTGDAQTCLTCRSCGDTCFRTCADTCRTQCDTCPGDTCGRTCNTCRTQCGQATCHTCQTRCGQATCQTCQTQCGTCQTCQTQCGQATCQTCQTRCGQATCHTCQTRCGQDTCEQTCRTCPGDTCHACTHVTCFRTCDC